VIGSELGDVLLARRCMVDLHCELWCSYLAELVFNRSRRLWWIKGWILVFLLREIEFDCKFELEWVLMVVLNRNNGEWRLWLDGEDLQIVIEFPLGCVVKGDIMEPKQKKYNKHNKLVAK
jgi:hypothetical protein